MSDDSKAAMAAMDAAATTAEKDFRAVFTLEQQRAFAAWWNTHYAKAGHKRLGRVMITIHKEATEWH